MVSSACFDLPDPIYAGLGFGRSGGERRGVFWLGSGSVSGSISKIPEEPRELFESNSLSGECLLRSFVACFAVVAVA